MNKVIAVNAGSSSIKYKMFLMPEETVVCSGIVDRIGHDDAIFKMKGEDLNHVETLPIKDHSLGVKLILDGLKKFGIVKDLKEIVAVGHRVVQGGKYFSKSVIFDEDAKQKIESLIPLDPLHAPAHIMGYEAFKKALPDAIEIAVFDTAYHQTMEEEDYLFPIPYELSKKYDIRRYGAHGTSHQYLVEKGIHDFLNDAPHSKIISCHIGSGASLTAALDGKSIATSMGLTPLGGVMMGTRSGDIDPSICDYLSTSTGMDIHQIYDLLNKKSGLLGVSDNLSNDTRDIEAAIDEGNENAIRAGKLFARRIADFIGQYYVRLGGCDLIIFSAGIGENSVYFRKEILKRVEEALKLDIDYTLNETENHKEALISKSTSPIKVAIIPTDEEVMIARDLEKALEGKL